MQARSALLRWFDRHRRDLPWRASGKPGFSAPGPYEIWISEIMLQQTRVETAIPYYFRFLARFPDVASLARADEAEVLALWSGLGYYRRCRALLAAARVVVAGGGGLPTSARELEQLPGIGPYTAAAIASIAFSEPVPVLDGNVERVLSRYAALPEGARTRGGRAALLALAATLLDRRRPGDSNQAMMELGATVCTPRAPSCSACPLAAGCAALAAGAPESYPAPAPRVGTARVQQLVALVEADGRLLLFRRSAAAGQLASLWEFPTVEPLAEPAPAACLAERFGGTWTLGEELFRLRHAITTRTFAIVVRRATFAAASGEVAEPRPPAASAGSSEPGWWSREEIAGLPLTGVARKVLARAGTQPG